MINLLKKYKWFFVFLSIPYLLIFIPTVLFTNYEIDLPGGIRPISDVIKIDKDYQSKGSFNSTFVITMRKCTLFQKWICSFDDRYQINEIKEEYNYYQYKEIEALNELTKLSSIQQSILAVYNLDVFKDNEDIYLNEKYIGKFVYDRASYKSIQNDQELQIGDIILGSSEEDVYNKIEAYKNGLVNTLRILRGNKDKRLEIEISPTIYVVNEKKLLGVSFINGLYNYYDLSDINPKYEVVKSNVGGDSGGLMQALSIFNTLTSFDYTYGKKIAGTGGVTDKGMVYAIGAIKQKIYTASKNKVDIFFVPDSDNLESYEHKNYLDALEAYQKIKFK